MSDETAKANDPVGEDAKEIAVRAADLGDARGKENADLQKEGAIDEEVRRLQAQGAAYAADADVQRGRERADVKAIADLDQDAQRRIEAVPGPNPPPMPPRPRVG